VQITTSFSNALFYFLEKKVVGPCFFDAADGERETENEREEEDSKRRERNLRIDTERGNMQQPEREETRRK